MNMVQSVPYLAVSSWTAPKTVPQLAQKNFSNIIVDKSSLIDLEARQRVTGRKQAKLAVQRERLSGKTPIWGCDSLATGNNYPLETGEGDSKKLPRLQLQVTKVTDRMWYSGLISAPLKH